MSTGEEIAYAKFKEALINFGVRPRAAEVYLLLVESSEELSGNQIVKKTNIPRTEIYRMLFELEGKGLIYGTLSRPVKYHATPLSETIENLIKIKKFQIEKQISFLRESGEQVTKLLVPYNISEYKILFSRLQGIVIYNKAREIARKTEKVCVSGLSNDIYRLYQNDFFDYLRGNCELVLKENSTGQSEYLKGRERVNVKMAKNNDVLHFILAGNEALLFLDADRSSMRMNNLRAMWTNEPEIVRSLRMLFQMLYSE